MQKLIFSFILFFFLFTGKSFAQNGITDPKKWGIEVELIQPFLPEVGIVRFQASRTITAPNKKRGDLIIGTYIRTNVKHDIVEKINELLFITGYRQYLWKGLHVEAKSNIGYAWGTRNLIDGKDHNHLSWFGDAEIGYKLDFGKKQGYNIYVLPQFGILTALSADIGPRGGKPDTFIQGNLMIGVNF